MKVGQGYNNNRKDFIKEVIVQTESMKGFKAYPKNTFDLGDGHGMYEENTKKMSQ